MSRSEPPVVLIVEDEPDVAETYARWLQGYDVRRVESGEAALAQLDETVDVVLLDRMLPGKSGAAVLDEIRARDIDCRVAMVTAVDPDFDIIEMGFDEYVTKPPEREQLRTTVERLLQRATLDDELQEYYSLVARRAALEAELGAERLESNDEYTALVDQIETHRAAADEALGDMASDSGFVGAIREIMDDSGHTGASDTSDSLDSQE